MCRPKAGGVKWPRPATATLVLDPYAYDLDVLRSVGGFLVWIDEAKWARRSRSPIPIAYSRTRRRSPGGTRGPKSFPSVIAVLPVRRG